MVYMLFEKYKKTPVSTQRKADEAVEDENRTLRQTIIDTFEFTFDPEDEIPCSVVEELLNADKKKIKNELESMKVKKIKYKTKPKRDKLYYVGIKKKKTEDEEDAAANGCLLDLKGIAKNKSGNGGEEEAKN